MNGIQPRVFGRKVSRGWPTKKRPKIALFSSIFYICTVYENVGGHGRPDPCCQRPCIQRKEKAKRMCALVSMIRTSLEFSISKLFS